LVDKASYLTILSRYIHLNPLSSKAWAKVPFQEKIGYLTGYSWSSLPGYLDERKREPFIEDAMALEEYGGETDNARKTYREAIRADVAEGLEIKDNILGQSILGGNEFIEWVKKRFIKRQKGQEIPSVKEIQRYRS